MYVLHVYDEFTMYEGGGVQNSNFIIKFKNLGRPPQNALTNTPLRVDHVLTTYVQYNKLRYVFSTY
jgi:hypothetical protein